MDFPEDRRLTIVSWPSMPFRSHFVPEGQKDGVQCRESEPAT